MPGYLLDTNVLSETRKRNPSEPVIRFLSDQPPSSLYLSCLTLGELRKGVEVKKRSDSAGAETLRDWVDRTERLYRHHLLPVNSEAATLWGRWSAQRSRPVVDTLLAATASIHHLVFVTRNSANVWDLPITILNPWSYGQ